MGFDPKMSEWGNPTERSLRKKSEHRESKYPSICRKINQKEIPSVVRANAEQPKLHARKLM